MRAMKLNAALFAVLLAAPALLAQNQTVRIHAATVLDGTGKIAQERDHRRAGIQNHVDRNRQRGQRRLTISDN